MGKVRVCRLSIDLFKVGRQEVYLQMGGNDRIVGYLIGAGI